MADNLLDKASILLTPTAYDNGSMLSIKPENGDGDFTFSRNSAATRVNAQGLVENVQIISSELVSNGDFSNGSANWSLGTGWSIGEYKAVATDVNSTFLDQLNILTIGKLYKITYTIQDYVSGTVRFRANLVNGSTNFANGTYTDYIVSGGTKFSLQGLNNFNGSITNVSVKEITDDTNIPRIDYTDGCGSWLLEPQSTNLYLNSETLSTQSNATSASTYTVSFYGTGTITFSGTHTGTLVGTGVNDRVSATFTATAGTLTSTVTGTVTKGQLEEQSYATSYIPTNGASSTRLQDIANNSGNASLINSTEGTLYASIAALTDDGSNRNVSLSKDALNRVNIFYRNGSNRIRFVVRINSVNLFDATITLSDIINYNKVALSFKENEFKAYVNGVKEAEQLSGSIFPADTLDRLGFNQNNGGSLPFYGKVKAVAVYKEALTDAELQSLTTI